MIHLTTLLIIRSIIRFYIYKDFIFIKNGKISQNFPVRETYKISLFIYIFEPTKFE